MNLSWLKTLLSVAVCATLVMCPGGPPATAQGWEEAVAVVAAVVGIASSVKSLLTTQENNANALAEISAKLDNLQQGISELNKKIEQVSEALRIIDEHITLAGDKEARIRVMTSIREIDEGFPDWRDTRDQSDTRSQAQRELDRLHHEALNLTDPERQGLYVNYNTVALAMAYEHSLFILLNSPPKYRVAHMKSFLKYFTVISDKTIVNSLAWQRDKAKARRLDLETAHNRMISRGYVVVAQNQPHALNGWDSTVNGCRNAGWTVYTVAEGDIRKGYAVIPGSALYSSPFFITASITHDHNCASSNPSAHTWIDASVPDSEKHYTLDQINKESSEFNKLGIMLDNINAALKAIASFRDYAKAQTNPVSLANLEFLYGDSKSGASARAFRPVLIAPTSVALSETYSG